MAHHKAAQKRIRRDADRKILNHARRHRIATFVKKAEEAMASGVSADARVAFQKAQSELMRGVTKGVLHKNTASRKISRLSSRIPA